MASPFSPVGGRPDGDEEAGTEGEGAAEEKGSSAGTTWLHCSVGPQLKEGEVEDGKLQVRRVLCIPQHSSSGGMEARRRI